MGGLTTFPLSWLKKIGKNNEIKPNHVSLITIYEYKVMEWRCIRLNKCMACMWSTNMCEACISSLEKGNDQGSSSKSFEILQDKYSCTPLYS